jgi:hypothetical protein
MIHEDRRTSAGLSWEALHWLESTVSAGMRTLETGAGLSTVIFAARGASHTVVTPVADEEAAIRALCASVQIDDSNVDFVIGRSEDVLPTLGDSPLDLVLVDGAHGFPYAILDWWHLSGRLEIGGVMLLDDAYIPPVLAILDGLRDVAAWRTEGSISDRTVALRKLSNDRPPAVWPSGRFGGHESFRYLPPRRRASAALRHRALATALGRRAVKAIAGRRKRSLGG